MESHRNIINGGLSGFFTVFVTQPFQVIRTSMMVTYADGKPCGFLYIIKQLKSKEGIKGFYRGFVPTIIKTPIGSAIFYSALEYNKIVLEKQNLIKLNHNSINFISSASARFVQFVLLNPILVTITRFEVIGFKHYNSLLDGLIKIKKEEGLRGFSVGLKPLLIKEVPTAACFYLLYENLKKIIHNYGIINLQFKASISAIMANIILTALNNPLDVIRTRLQYLHFSSNKNHNYKRVFRGIIDIYSNEGIKGLTVGIVPRIFKRTIASAISWTVYETLKLRSHNKINII